VRSFGISFFATDGTNVDLAPNSGNWLYTMTPLELTIQAFNTNRAKAGRSFTVQMAVIRSDLGTALAEGTVTCTAKVGARTLAGTGTLTGGRTTRSWRLPKSARGKRLTGSVAVAFQGVEARRSFVQPVR
jgi:hypothetical protein